VTDRRFTDGERFEIPPMQYRVVRGRKDPEDLKLQWRYMGDWRPVELDHVALIVDAIGDNEETLYPRERGGRGNGKVLTFVKQSIRDGFRQAIHDLHEERARRDEMPPEERWRRGRAS
jgi:hypothetical protein